MKWKDALALRERGLTYREIAEKLGTTPNQIGAYMQRQRMTDSQRLAWSRHGGQRRARLTPNAKRGPWSVEERLKLRVYFNDLTYEQIAKKLNRTVNAVAGQCHRLGLKKSA